MVFGKIVKKIGRKNTKEGLATLDMVLEENRGIGKYKSIKSLLRFVQEISTDDPTVAAIALKLAIIEYIQRHQLPEEEKQKLVRALIQRPNRVNVNVDPVEVLDSAIYAVFIKKELQRTIEELPVTEERKVEYMAEITQIVRDILFTRALNEVRTPSDVRRISTAFGVPEDIIRAMLYPRAQKNYKRKKTYRNSQRKNDKAQEQKKNEEENTNQNNGGDSE